MDGWVLKLAGCWLSWLLVTQPGGTELTCCMMVEIRNWRVESGYCTVQQRMKMLRNTLLGLLMTDEFRCTSELWRVLARVMVGTWTISPGWINARIYQLLLHCRNGAPIFRLLPRVSLLSFPFPHPQCISHSAPTMQHALSSSCELYVSRVVYIVVLLSQK